jgi:hypothetical protein
MLMEGYTRLVVHIKRHSHMKQEKVYLPPCIQRTWPKGSQRSGKSSGWHLLGPEFDFQWEHFFGT